MQVQINGVPITLTTAHKKTRNPNEIAGLYICLKFQGLKNGGDAGT